MLKRPIYRVTRFRKFNSNIVRRNENEMKEKLTISLYFPAPCWMDRLLTALFDARGRDSLVQFSSTHVLRCAHAYIYIYI